MYIKISKSKILFIKLEWYIKFFLLCMVIMFMNSKIAKCINKENINYSRGNEKEYVDRNANGYKDLKKDMKDMRVR